MSTVRITVMSDSRDGWKKTSAYWEKKLDDSTKADAWARRIDAHIDSYRGNGWRVLDLNTTGKCPKGSRT